MTVLSLKERERLFNQHEKIAYFACSQWMRRNSGFIARYRLEQDDLQSIALIAVWNATAVWDSSKGKFSTLASVAVVSKLNHVLREKQAVRRGSGEALPLSLYARVGDAESIERLDLLRCPVADMPEHAVLGELRHGALWVELDKLPVQQAEALRLRYVDDNTNYEVAELLGTSPQTASHRVTAGLARLRVALQN